MDEEESRVTATNDDRQAAIAWLRDMLTSILEVAPLPPWINTRTHRMIRRLPDWLIAAWAEAVNVDYVTAYQACPDLTQEVRSSAGRETIQRYLETLSAVPFINILNQLVRKVVKLSKTDRLPVDNDMIERQVCALALASCSPYGGEFDQQLGSILCDTRQNNHPLIEYQIIMDGGQRQKLEELDAALASSAHSKWVAERIAEMKRWLGLEPPRFNIHYAERRPEWDIFWKSIFLGGGNEH